MQRTSFNDFAERTAAANRKNRCSVSQLLEASVVRGLAEWHLADHPPVTVNRVNPGLCRSEFGREYAGWDQVTFKALPVRRAVGRLCAPLL